MEEARDSHAPEQVMAAARKMHSETLRTKHTARDALVAFVLDCTRCGPPGPLGSGRRVRARPLGALGAGAGRPRATRSLKTIDVGGIHLTGLG